jgi:hypothetical protein
MVADAVTASAPPHKVKVTIAATLAETFIQA